MESVFQALQFWQRNGSIWWYLMVQRHRSTTALPSLMILWQWDAVAYLCSNYSLFGFAMHRCCYGLEWNLHASFALVDVEATSPLWETKRQSKAKERTRSFTKACCSSSWCGRASSFYFMLWRLPCLTIICVCSIYGLGAWLAIIIVFWTCKLYRLYICEIYVWLYSDLEEWAA